MPGPNTPQPGGPPQPVNPVPPPALPTKTPANMTSNQMVPLPAEMVQPVGNYGPYYSPYYGPYPPMVPPPPYYYPAPGGY
jgi:hypothetical protein